MEFTKYMLEQELEQEARNEAGTLDYVDLAEECFYEAAHKLKLAWDNLEAVERFHANEEASEEWLLRCREEVHELTLLGLRFAEIAGL